MISLGLGLAMAALAQGGEQPAAIAFTDVTAASGLNMQTVSGDVPSTQIPEAKGGGLALIDFDADGDLDVFVPNGATLAAPEHGPGARLWENLGGLNWRDVTAASGIDHHRWSFGAAVGDYDADGLDDIYVCCLGPDVLWRNLGGGKFTDATAAAGLPQDTQWDSSAAFADLDLDGDLDLVVIGYLKFDPAAMPAPSRFKDIAVMAGPRGMTAEPDRLYENLGNGGFADRSVESGLRAAAPADERFGLNLAVADLTLDGKPDIFIANDSQADQLFEGQGGLRFNETGRRRGVATNIEGTEQASMGIALGDVDLSGSPDLLVSVFSSDTNTLHLNRAGQRFDDRSSQYGVAAPSRTLCGWAAALADLDNDRDEDLLVFNGHVYPQATMATMDSDYAQRPLLMERDGPRFRAVSGGEWATAHRDRSAVFADLDHDGDIDVIVAEQNGPLRVLRNDHDNSTDSVVVALPGRGGQGALVELEQDGLVQRRWFWGGGPFQSNTPQEAHFGVKPGETCQLRLHWRDGETEQRSVLPGQRLVIRRLKAAG